MYGYFPLIFLFTIAPLLSSFLRFFSDNYFILKYGLTALHFACAGGSIEIVREILRMEVDVGATTTKETMSSHDPLKKVFYHPSFLLSSSVFLSLFYFMFIMVLILITIIRISHLNPRPCTYLVILDTKRSPDF